MEYILLLLGVVVGVCMYSKTKVADKYKKAQMYYELAREGYEDLHNKWKEKSKSIADDRKYHNYLASIARNVKFKTGDRAKHKILRLCDDFACFGASHAGSYLVGNDQVASEQSSKRAQRLNLS